MVYIPDGKLDVFIVTVLEPDSTGIVVNKVLWETELIFNKTLLPASPNNSTTTLLPTDTDGLIDFMPIVGSNVMLLFDKMPSLVIAVSL